MTIKPVFSLLGFLITGLILVMIANFYLEYSISKKIQEEQTKTDLVMMQVHQRDSLIFTLHQKLLVEQEINRQLDSVINVKKIQVQIKSDEVTKIIQNNYDNLPDSVKIVYMNKIRNQYKP